MIEPSDELVTKTLRRFEFAAQEAIDLGALRVGAERLMDYCGSRLLLTIRSSIYGERGREYVEEVPASWWSFFRLACFPRWANRRWKHEIGRAHV